MIVLPTADLAAYRYRVTLDGVPLVLRLRYASRTSAWYLDVSDSAGAPIRQGIKVVRNFPLTGRIVDPRWPGGDIFAYSRGSGPLGRDGLEGVVFFYLTAAEQAAARDQLATPTLASIKAAP